MAYAANVPPKRRKNKSNSSNSARVVLHCSHCKKDGHIASKCWNKPPYYCLKCKAQGHTLRDCSGKGKQKANAGGNTSKSKGNGAKQKHKREEDEEEANGDQSMIMLTPTVTQDGTVLDCALHARTAKQRGKNPEQQQVWIMDSGATSHMTPHAHIPHDQPP